ncbi:MAG: type II secretion system GspH family protein [Clostridiales bacterium]|nr:type II secretion system GspH family protein [Clostridiales bacterium]
MSGGGERRARFRAATGKRGFTLVELIVSMGIMTALIGLVIAVIMAAFGNYDRGARLTDAKQKVQSIYNFCERRLAEASAVSINPAVAPGTESVIYVSGGHLFFGTPGSSAVDIFGSEFYAGHEVRILVYCEGTVMHLTVELRDTRENKLLYVREGAFSLSGLRLAGKTVTNPPAAANPAVNPRIYFH